jgi:polyketide cyclase/dehydrase/lipid transport protein
MTTANWTPAAESITTADESFFTSADFVLAATIDLPHSPAQIWGALTDDRLGAWMPIVDRARWIDPPPRSRGARRTIRLLRLVTIDEEFHIWNEQSLIAFRALDLRPRVARAWGEQAELGALPDGGTRLTYTVAIDSLILRLVPRSLTRPMAALSRRALRGIVTVLPSPGAPVGAERR